MYSIFRKEWKRKLNAPSEKLTHSDHTEKWQCQICGASIFVWTMSRRNKTKKHRDANYILSGGGAII